MTLETEVRDPSDPYFTVILKSILNFLQVIDAHRACSRPRFFKLTTPDVRELDGKIDGEIVAIGP